MARSKVFIQRKDGRIELRIAPAAREFLKSVVDQLITAENDSEHPWHGSLHAPITPSADNDDPLRSFERQKMTATSAELMRLTLDESFLSQDEAFAWLASMQLGLRARTTEAAIFTVEDLNQADDTSLQTIRALQFFLFELATTLS
ncbi:MAG: hypothetical protein WCG62_00225 [Actinomycetes bacterium]